MSIGCRMRGLGVSSHYTKILKPHLDEICGDTKYVLKNSMDNGVIVHTDRIEDEKFSLINDIVNENRENGKINTYNHHIEISWRDINKYAECEVIKYSNYTRIRDDLYDINPNYRADITSDGEWVYPLPNLETITTKGWGIGFTANPALKKWNIPLPKLTTAKEAFTGSVFTEWTVGFPGIVNGFQIFNTNRVLTRFSGSLDKLTEGSQFFWGNSKLTDFSSDLPKLQNGFAMFNETILNKKSVLHIVDTIPSYNSGTHNLGIGIHVDHQNDEEVLAAIATAEAKGWTLTVQWNGTATSTASVMRFGQLIYAKVDEIERPDGTTEEVLDWGHYVTNPEGYETFRSLESAYEYFNLEMPISEV